MNREAVPTVRLRGWTFDHVGGFAGFRDYGLGSRD